MSNFTPTITRAHKNPVRVATTGAVTLSGIQTIDDIVLVAGNRILVKDNNNATNGIYIVSSGGWIRSPDADNDRDIFPGMQVYVQEGTVNRGKLFYINNTGPTTLNATTFTFGVLQEPDLGSEDLTLIDELTNLNTVAYRYVDSRNGNDTTGNGLIDNPWETCQRAVDAIPIGKCAGIYQVNVLPGFYEGVIDFSKVRGIETEDTGQYLQISFVGSGDIVLAVPSIPSPSNIPIPTGEGLFNYPSLKRYDMGAHPSFSSAYYWFRAEREWEPGFNVFEGYVIDRLKSISPYVDIAYQYDLSNQGFVDSNILTFETKFRSDLLIIGPQHQNGKIIVQFHGIELDRFAASGRVEFYGCVLKGIVFLQGAAGETTANYSFNSPLLSSESLLTVRIDGSASIRGGIYRHIPSYSSLIISNGQVAISGAIISGPSTAIINTAYTGAAAHCQLNVSWSAFEGTSGTAKGLTLTNATARIDTVSSDGLQTLATLSFDSQLRIIGAIGGSTSGVPIVLSNGILTTGLSTQGTTGRLRNSLTPGQDVTVGGVGTFAFSDLPQIDLGQFVRAT
jgi:hypothetical protein